MTMKKSRLSGMIAALAAALLLAAAGGCGKGEDPIRAWWKTVPTRQLKADEAKGIRQGDAVVPLLSDGVQYHVPMREVAMIAGFELKRDFKTRTYTIGYHDPLIELRPDSADAVRDGRPVSLPEAPCELNGALHLPLPSFRTLFGDLMSFTAQGSRLLIHARGEEEAGRGQAEPGFGDERAEGMRAASGGETGQTVGDRVVLEAQKYLGVPYEFGTGPYSETNRRFDCSTFTRHVFARFGIDLPRTAREQAQKGESVPMSALRKGDLLFFRVPGRFADDNTIGHVGIYIGGGRMIHASPEPKNGVQISDLDSPHWKETFVAAKRLL